GLLASAGGEDGGIAAIANGQKKLSRSSLDEQSLLLGSPLVENSQVRFMTNANFGFVAVGKDKTSLTQTMSIVMKVKMLGGRNWKKRYNETSDIEDIAVLPYQRWIRQQLELGNEFLITEDPQICESSFRFETTSAVYILYMKWFISSTTNATYDYKGYKGVEYGVFLNPQAHKFKIRVFDNKIQCRLNFNYCNLLIPEFDIRWMQLKLFNLETFN
uniref:Uncharacterized protein n=1 Tax=Wuchereria bancrofti TaxID=6293 RepID=A0A1I8EYA3_WUCBA